MQTEKAKREQILRELFSDGFNPSLNNGTFYAFKNGKKYQASTLETLYSLIKKDQHNDSSNHLG